MLYILPLLLVSVDVSQPSGVSTTDHRLAPPLLVSPRKPPRTVPEWLTKGEVVSNPEELLRTLRDTQQKSWEQLGTLKGRAWQGSVAYGGASKSVTWLMEFSFSKDPRQNKELRFGSNELMEKRLAGGEFDPLGLDPDQKNALYCINATICRPDMRASAVFLKYMRPDTYEMVTIVDPDSKTKSSFGLDGFQFGFKMSPAEFFDTYLPTKVEEGGKLVVRTENELLELRVVASKHPSVYLFDLSKNGIAIATYVRGVKRETEYRNVDDFWLPESYKQEGLGRYTEMRFFEWAVNKPLDADEFSLRSLPVSAGTPVKDVRKNTTVSFSDWED